ncbi:MAG: 16S rRNA (guanine(527)-N(7))-methyltransferase RsmG [Paracoccaceae bacterium]|nr:16S rRNA (guanine(527)-N(7))-methyltransferase RsmG [Paracoccaceae bacterium]
MNSSAEFTVSRNVSRETLEKLKLYEALLRKWTPAINLVAKSTLDTIWERHFLDSAQVFDLAPKSGRHWVDMGSGGGFPGMIAAILAGAERPEMQVTLVESDNRKATFLATVARETDTPVTVISERVESLPDLSADILTARALAPLDQLLAFADKHLMPTGTALFQKGANHTAEIEQAIEKWQFSLQKHISMTDPNAVILAIGGIKRV